MNCILMKSKTKPQGLEERCSVCVAASGCRFPSQLHKCCLCGLSWRRKTQAGCLLPSPTEALSHWTGTRLVCTSAWRQQTHGLKLLWGEMWPHIRVCLFFGVVLVTGWLSWIEQSPKGAGRFKGHSWLGKWLTEECRREGAFEEKHEMVFLPQYLLGLLWLRRWHKCTLLWQILIPIPVQKVAVPFSFWV